MSQNAPASTDKPTKLPSAQKLDSTAKPQDFKALDRATERIRKANLPPAPYIVYIDGPTYSGRAAGHQWTLNTPFSPEEGHLQYQSLLYRDTSDSLLRLRAAHEDEEFRRERAMNASGASLASGNGRSGANTPLNATSTAKKKISLGDYKSRKEAGSQATTPNAHSRTQSSDLRKETLKRELGSAGDSNTAAKAIETHATDETVPNDVPIEPMKDGDSHASQEPVPLSQDSHGDPKPTQEPASSPKKRHVDEIASDGLATSPSPPKKARSSPEESHNVSRKDFAEKPASTKVAPQATSTKTERSKVDVPKAKSSDTSESKSRASKIEEVKAEDRRANSIKANAPKPKDSESVLSKPKTPDLAANTTGKSRPGGAAPSKVAHSPPNDTVEQEEAAGKREKTPLITVSTAPPSRNQEKPSKPNVSPLVQPAKPKDAPKRHPDTTKAAATSSSSHVKKSSVSSVTSEKSARETQISKDHKEQPKPESKTSSPDKVDKPKIQAAKDPVGQERLPTRPSTEKGLCSWLPLGNSPHIPEEHRVWVPPTSDQRKTRMPPPLSNPEGKSPVWLPSRSSQATTQKDRSTSTKPIPKSSPETGTKQVSKPEAENVLKPGKVTNEEPSAGPSTSAVEKTKDPKKSMTQSPQVAPKTHNMHEPVNGAHKAVRTVKAPGGSSTFFQSFAPSKQSTSSRTVPAPVTHAVADDTCIVKLKYGRQHVKTVERILKLKASPSKEHSSQNAVDKDQSRTEASTTLKPDARKRPATDSGDPSQAPSDKRRRTIDPSTSPQRSQTPQRSQLLSPATVTPARTKHQGSQSPSRDSNAASQKPDNPQGSSLSPMSSATIARAGSAATSYDWRANREESENLGRRLKRSMLEAMKGVASEEFSDEDPMIKMAVVHGIESLLCFMKAFDIHARHSKNVRASTGIWESILPWAREVAWSCQRFPHLDGLVCFLRSVCCDQLCKAVMRTPPPTGTEGASATDPAQERHTQVYTNYSDAQRYAREFSRLLPAETLVEQYPEAYGELRSILQPTAESAVKGACSFLREWTRREDVAWTCQLEEDL